MLLALFLACATNNDSDSQAISTVVEAPVMHQLELVEGDSLGNLDIPTEAVMIVQGCYYTSAARVCVTVSDQYVWQNDELCYSTDNGDRDIMKGELICDDTVFHDEITIMWFE